MEFISAILEFVIASLGWVISLATIIALVYGVITYIDQPYSIEFNN